MNEARLQDAIVSDLTRLFGNRRYKTLVGMFDDDRKNQGHRAVLEILEEVRRHYEELPLLDGAFVFSDPYRWTLQEEESYPYFFGGAELSFDLPAPRRKWSELV